MSLDGDGSIDQLVTTFYAAFDNRGGKPMKATILRALFVADARIVRISEGKIESWSVDAFIEPRERILSAGVLVEFQEWETASETKIVGNIASRQSRYEKSGFYDGVSLGGGGTLFIQCCRVDGVWKITSILWEDDVAG